VLRLVRERLAMLVLVLSGVSVVTFLMSHVLPGDPAAALAGPRPSKEVLRTIRHQFGLDRPLPIQYVSYLNDLIHGNLGTSIRTQDSVTSELLRYFPATLELITFAFIIAILIGIPLGVISAVKKNSFTDYIVRLFAVGGVSIPLFWGGLVLILIFYAKLGWLPASGRLDIELSSPQTVTGFYTIDTLIAGDTEAFFNAVKHLIMPAFALGYVQLAFIVRQVRSSMLDALSQDYYLTGRANGLSKRFLIIRYALRNALIPSITIIGLSFGSLLGGAVVTETIFDWPGMGKYVTESILGRDFPAIMGFTIMIALVYVLINLLVDLLVYSLDPQTRK
jgi:peptide/nickel transport system permease protein